MKRLSFFEWKFVDSKHKQIRPHLPVTFVWIVNLFLFICISFDQYEIMWLARSHTNNNIIMGWGINEPSWPIKRSNNFERMSKKAKYRFLFRIETKVAHLFLYSVLRFVTTNLTHWIWFRLAIFFSSCFHLWKSPHDTAIIRIEWVMKSMCNLWRSP